MSGALDGRVTALIGHGGELDRAIAVALAEAGANLAISTAERLREQEYQAASIANEVWAIGREQFSHVMNAADPAQSQAYAQETVTRLGGLDALVMIELDASACSAIAEAIRRVVPGSVAVMVSSATYGNSDEITSVPANARQASEVAADVVHTVETLLRVQH